MFKQLNNMYLRDTNAALIVYDISDEASIKQAEEWVEILREQAPSETVLSLLGNKMDSSSRKLQYQDGQNFARKHKIDVVGEVSAKTGENVDNFMNQIALQCYQNAAKFPKRMREGTFKLNPNNQAAPEAVGGKKKKKCC